MTKIQKIVLGQGRFLCYSSKDVDRQVFLERERWGNFELPVHDEGQEAFFPAIVVVRVAPVGFNKPRPMITIKYLTMEAYLKQEVGVLSSTLKRLAEKEAGFASTIQALDFNKLIKEKQ